jgi:diaminohydroxyphosphoribosylaminopyrimidine deaminase/5-amino-6-(5-phosphoribosylamino)uracil reductase
MTSEAEFMQRCLTLALKAKGKTSPNPLVGAIAVKNNQIIGEGFHPGVGQPHAEIFALREAGEAARDSTIYVNLEPCNHYGKTPPCTDALIKSRVKKVVVGMIDPDPRVSGKGVERLRNAGIEVVIGVEEKACRELNEAFIYRVTHQRPFGILKYAMTLDGKIATISGHSSWITGELSRRYVHKLRGDCDAIIVGGNTVRQDNPLLTTHGVTDFNPLRIVMSRDLNLPEDCQLWDTSIAATMVFTQKGSNPHLQNLLFSKGVQIIEFNTLTPAKVMNYLYEQGKNSVLWECGGVLAAQAIASGCVQKVYAFIAPKIIGGLNAPSPVGDLGFLQMSEAIELKPVKLTQIDQDFLLQGYLC